MMKFCCRTRYWAHMCIILFSFGFTVVVLFVQALYASKIISYAQGFMLIREVAKQMNWKLNFGAIALMWRGGCIIRR